jgi:hypothetical protein
MVVDQRAGQSPLEQPGATLDALAAWLSELNRDAWIPMVVAGDEELDFAAFILYLSRELLEPEQAAILGGELRRFATAAGRRGDGGDADVAPERIEELVEMLQPVTALVQEWKERELVVFNWTNWDHIALRQAQLDGRAAVAFQRRSDFKDRQWEEAFYLRLRLPPVGPDARAFRMIGGAVSLTEGEGPRADAAEALQDLVLASELQHGLEAESPWSPVRLEGAPINREHRDVVRWYQSSEAYWPIDERTAAHPLFRRMHQVLR